MTSSGIAGLAALPHLPFAANRPPFRSRVQVDGSWNAGIHRAALAAEKADSPTMTSSIFDILQAAAPAAGEPPAWVTFMPFVGMAVIFWFFILRPQMR